MSAGDYVRKSDAQMQRIADAIDAARTIWIGTTTNSSNNYTGTATVPVTRLITGESVRCIINAANTGAVTLAIKRPDGSAGVAATAVKKIDGTTALGSGDLGTGPREFLYDGSVLRLWR